jgi:RNA polymerase sigma factor (TIGR02999 family)
MSAGSEVTVLLSAWRAGNRDALEQLIPIVYNELRRVAGRYMRSEQPGHTLQTTALVHEAYMHLAKEQDRSWENRAHFFAVAAQIMRNLLLDHARSAKRAKRGGAAAHVTLGDVAGPVNVNADDLLALDDVLRRFAEIDPRAARVVELRYFVGLSNAEIAAVLGASEKTVMRDWSAAKVWLHAQLRSRR